MWYVSQGAKTDRGRGRADPQLGEAGSAARRADAKPDAEVFDHE